MAYKLHSFLFTNRTTRQILMKNSLWLGGIELVSKLILFVATVWVVRFYGPLDFGKLNLANAGAAMMLFAADFGISTILTRDIARNRARAGSIYLNSMVLKLASSFLLFVLYMTVIALLPSTRGSVWLYFSAGIFVLLQSFEALQVAFLSAFESMERVFAVRTTHYVGIVLSAFLAVTYHLSLVWLLALYSISALLAILVSVPFMIRLGSGHTARFDGTLMKSIFFSSLPIFGTLAISQLYINTDTVLIGHFFSPVEVGIYQSAYKILFAFQSINLINTAVFPRMSVLIHEHKQKILLKLFRMLVGMSLVILVPLALVISWNSETVITRIYGDTYRTAAPVLAILVWVGVVNYFRIFASNILIARGRQKKVFMAVLIGLIANVVLNYLVMPQMGFAFASVTFLISEVGILSVMAGFMLKQGNLAG